MTSKTYCPAPWISAAITTSGYAKPCNNFAPNENFKKISASNNFQNSEVWIDMRSQMLEGKQIQGCVSCYDKEKINLKSTRELFIEWLGVSDKVELQVLEVAFSNTCNLACVGCDSSYSSKWAMEDYKHKRRPDIPIIKSSKINFEFINLQNLKVLKMLGGEPLLHQEDFINLLEKVNRKEILLTITTNATFLPNQRLKELIEECREVHYYVSIDGTYKVNEWYRWPSNSEITLANIDTYYNWWKDTENIMLVSHTIINAYNIWDLDDFILGMQKKYPNWIFDFDWLTFPNWASLAVIPNIYKNELKERLLKCHDSIKGEFLKNRNPFVDSLLFLDATSDANWDDFIMNTKRLELERNIRMLDYVPLLKGKI